ncbi:Phosphomethylpyrimidine kinase-domain-containing protein [Geopyxis carbonaria]|nr:Phosphomethylpyrimidine kinase-domain-containing protein [Geopyxis carbonaria]
MVASNPPKVLTIAGSDPSGGAGIEADLKVITAHGCYGMTAMTALTAQDTTGVKGIHKVPVEHFQQSLKMVLLDIPPDVIKTGMLTSSEHIGAMMKTLADTGNNYRYLIVDPVMVSTSGSNLLSEDAVSDILLGVLPKAYLVTPNIPEAELLLKAAKKPFGKKVTDLASMREMAQKLKQLGPAVVVLKGGHCPLDKDGNVTADEDKRVQVVDIFWDGKEEFLITNPYNKTTSTHGTGCSLSSAIASNLAKGFPAVEAVKQACAYVAAGIRTAPKFGKGNGPIDHLHSCYTLPFAPGNFLDYLLNHPKVKGPWKAYTEHEFVNQMGLGTLNVECFKNYLVQDYLFLIQFSRSTALGAYKARDIDSIAASAQIILHIQREMSLHIGYCESFGLSKAQIESAKETMACTAYTRYVLDVGQSSDRLALQVAMAPCLLGYYAIAERLMADPSTVHGEDENLYYKWIQNYVADDYYQAVVTGRQQLEDAMCKVGIERIEELVDIFVHATNMEAGFWEMGLTSGQRQDQVELQVGAGKV